MITAGLSKSSSCRSSPDNGHLTYYMHSQVENVRPETIGSGEFPAISGSRIRKSVPGSGSDWFPVNSGIRTLLTYPFVVSRAVPICGSAVSWPWPDPSSVPFRSGTDTEARIRPFPSGSSRCNNSTNTGQSSKSTGAKLTLRYLANQ